MNSFRRAMVLSVIWSTSVAAVEWTELSSSSDAPSPRARHTMVVLDDGSAVMFGGKNFYGYRSNDIYTLTVNDTKATWVQLSSAGDIPSVRDEHTMVVLADGSAVMFGGWGWLNDIYTLTVTGTNATWFQLSSVGDVPVGRYSHTMTVLHDGSAVMFGGECASSPRYLNDIYSLTVTGTIATWVQLSSAGDVPRMRADHTMGVLADGSAVMFGGFDYWNFLNDIYSLTVSGTTATWVQLSSVGDAPSGRQGHTMTVLHDGSAVMFGGNDEWYNMNDIFSLTVSGTTATWVKLSSVGDVPRKRQRHTVTVLHDGSAVMFGGYSGMYDGGLYYLNDNLNDDHTLTSTTLTPTIPTLPTAAAVKITLSITATAADEEEVCETPNLDRGGGTYGSFVAGPCGCDARCHVHSFVYGRMGGWLHACDIDTFHGQCERDHLFRECRRVVRRRGIRV